MLKLHGFSASNYYNIAKLALLEKELPFEEVVVYTGAGPKYRPDYLDASPMGKVPVLETPDGFISESRCIVDYLERSHPERPLYPDDAFAVGKLLELTQVIDLYLELPVRRFIPYFFSGAKPPEAMLDEVAATVEKAALALGKLASFESFLLGDQFSAADLAGAVHFPLVRNIGGRFLGTDPLADVPGLVDYAERMAKRPHVERVRADSEANMPEFVAHITALYT